MTLTDDFQYDIDGFTIGKGTPYKVMSIEGLFELPDVQSSDTGREGVDGDFSGDDEVLTGKTITVQLVLLDENRGASDSLYDALAAATNNISYDVPLTIRRPGKADRIIYVRTRRRAFRAGWNFSTGLGDGLIEFKALDPRMYSGATHSLLKGLGTSTQSGRGYPLSFPYGYGGILNTAGTINCYNAGNYSAPAVIRLDGPLTAPRITHQESGRTITLTTSIATGEFVLIDLDSHNLLYQGTSSRRAWLDPTSRWFMLAPGDNTLAFRSSGVNEAGTMTITWKDAWV